MDTTPEYIRMCEMAPEIQALRYRGKHYEPIDIYPELYHEGVLRVSTAEIGPMPQEEPAWQDGDYFAFPKHTGGEVGIICSRCEYEFGEYDRSSFIWLPRQDELQGMMGSYEDGMDALKWYIYDVFYCEGGAYPHPLWVDWYYYDQFISFEQLWLAFVMKKNYGKVWIGKEWVKA